MFASLQLNGPPQKTMTSLLFHSLHNNTYILEQQLKKNTTKKIIKINRPPTNLCGKLKKSAFLQVRKQNDFFKGRMRLCQCA